MELEQKKVETEGKKVCGKRGHWDWEMNANNTSSTTQWKTRTYGVYRVIENENPQDATKTNFLEEKVGLRSGGLNMIPFPHYP